MDELVAPLLFVLMLAAAGWILGIVGFFKARSALAEAVRLRATVQQLLTAMPRAAADEAPIAVPVPVAPMAVAPMAVAPMAVAPSPPVMSPPVMPPFTPDPVTHHALQSAPATPPPGKARRDVEELLTAKWGVWLGAAALLMSGVFLVRYASDEGLLGPGVRCIGMVLLAAALTAAAEWLKRRARHVSDLADYAPQALAAGAVGFLLGAAYMAGALYALVPPLVGFALMAAASVAGLVLSLRHGPLVAAMGVVGGFITPLLMQTDDPYLPGLFAYLLCLTAGSLALVRFTAWTWLGWATIAAGAAWVLLATIAAGGVDLWAAAFFVPAAALLNLALLPSAALEHPLGVRLAWVPIAALGTAGLLLAWAEPGFATRAAVLLLVPLTIGKAGLEPRLDRLPWLAATLFLLLILGWGLPDWRPTGTEIGDSIATAILPGAWAPDVLQPLLETAALVAAIFAAAGLWWERRAPRPLGWSGQAAAIPVVALAVLYVRVRNFQPDLLWAAAALALAMAGTVAATRAARDARQSGRRRAGVHAAGATAALALGCAMLLTNQWLTLAFALFLPALAWIEARADLVALRRVAMAAAAMVLIRLLVNPNVLTYARGETPVLNDLLPVYAVSAVAFAVTAWVLKRRRDDLLVAVLELGGVAFASALAMLEIRHWATGGEPASADTGFRELALQVAALALLAFVSLRLEERTGRPMLGWAWRIQGLLAMIGGILLILGNPAFIPSITVGTHPIANALLIAYACPALLAGLALRRRGFPAKLRPIAWAYALIAVFAWITLEVRIVYHPGAMSLDQSGVEDGELWAWSGAWLGYGLVLMAIGVAKASKPLRLAALAIVGLAGAKVFLVDMSGLVGLWRVLSFLGLGLTLIGLGAVYRRFVAKEA